MTKELEGRVGDLEVAVGRNQEGMVAIRKELAEIKAALQEFLGGAEERIRLGLRVEALEKLVAQLETEHKECLKQSGGTTTWWRERAGRLVDFGIVALITWLLMMYKTH